MARRAVALVALLLALSGCSTGASDQAQSDELYDFAETTQAPSSGMPYDVYTRIADDQGQQVLPFGEVEARSLELCDAAPSTIDPQELGRTELAIVRAYCPQIEMMP